MRFWHKIGQQLQHPQGRAGKLVGHAMHLLNTKPNTLAIAGLCIQPSDHILELGFGPGQAIKKMAQLATLGRVYGIDASPAMLTQAIRRNRRAIKIGQISLSLGEFSPLPISDNSLDKILAVNVVYFWQNAPAILAECHRVLRPDGKISIYATDASAMQKWKFAGSDTHVLYTEDNLRSALLKGGFANNDIRIETVYLPTRIKGLLAIGQKSITSNLSTT